MDEAWSILAARGEWAPADPLSGMTRYSGPFPVLLLQLFGTEHGLSVLRGTGLICNAVAVGLVAAILARAQPQRGFVATGVAAVAFVPCWLAMARNGIEIGMFGPMLVLLGVYGLLRQERLAVFISGVCFGLASYNHVAHAFVPASLAVAWLLVYRRLPSVSLVPLLAGLALGLAPRAAALALYFDRGLEGGAARYDFTSRLLDLPALPAVLWDALHGRSVYMRFVGRLRVWVAPYYLVGLVAVLPWVWRRRLPPRSFFFLFTATIVLSVITTVGALAFAVRFFVFPAIGVALCVVVLAAQAAHRFPRWRPAMHAVVVLLAAMQVFYAVANFSIPWYRGSVRIAGQQLGGFNQKSWGFMPKVVLAERLRELNPDVVLTGFGTLQRPLKVLLPGVRVEGRYPRVGPEPKHPVLVTYRLRRHPDPTACIPGRRRRRCFSRAEIVDKHYVVYR